MIAINKYSSKLKNWSVEMPNAPYSHRWHSLGQNENKENNEKYNTDSFNFNS
jgi:hypothetical protein